LQELIGKGYRIEEEGLNGRTTAFNDPFNPSLNGLKYLDCCLMIRVPVDLLIITPGTNDTKEYFGVSAFHIAMGLEQLILKAKGRQYGPKGKAPEILIIVPQPPRDDISEKWTGSIFGKGSLEKAKALSKEYRITLLMWQGSYFFVHFKKIRYVPIFLFGHKKTQLQPERYTK
jgi:lysophospholipase L1-like esterase